MIGRHKRLTLAVAVALVLVAVVVSAALADTPSATPGTQSNSQGVQYGQVFLDKLAALLGVQRDKLDSAIKDAGKQTADEAVKNGDMTQQQADNLKSRIDNGQTGFFDGKGWFGDGGGMGKGVDGRGFSGMGGQMWGIDVQQVVADALGMKVTDLQSALKSGKSMTDILKEQGKTESDVRTAVVNAVKPKLDQAVTDGKMTQKQADEIVSMIQNGKFPMMGWGEMHKQMTPGKATPTAKTQSN